MRKRCTDSTSLSPPELTVPRGKTLESDPGAVDDHNFFVPCNAPHVPQHVAVSLFGPLNQIVISSAPSAKTDFAYLD